MSHTDNWLEIAEDIRLKMEYDKRQRRLEQVRYLPVVRRMDGAGLFAWSLVHARLDCWYYGGRTAPVHNRNILLQLYEAPSLGNDFLHHCDNPPCVREDHLWQGTAKENALDRYIKGR